MKKDTLPTLFRAQVEKYGDRVAMREKNFGIWQEISWNTYYNHVKPFCLGLIGLGLQKGDRVSIIGENGPRWLYADLAVQSAGCISVGIYPTNPAYEVKYHVNHSESKFFIAGDQEQADKVIQIKDECPSLEKVIVIDMKGLRNYDYPYLVSFDEVAKLGEEYEKKDPGAYERLIEEHDSDEVCIIIYTSGTTGPPKGSMISHRNVLSMVDALVETNPIGDSDSIVSYLPLNHVAERMMSVFIPLKTGATINFAESIEAVQESLREISPTFFLGVPRIWEKIASSVMIRMEDATFTQKKMYKLCMSIATKVAQHRLARTKMSPGLRLANLFAYLWMTRPLLDRLGLLRTHFAMSGGAPVSLELLKFFHGLGVPIREAYGQTESCGVAFIHWGDDIRIGTTGRPVRGVDCKIMEDGEILLKGDIVFKGYYQDPEATAETLVDGWLVTGDVGAFDEKGHLTITDRKKDIIITRGGKNISPSEIENMLKFSPYINEAVIIGEGRKYLTALIQIEYDTVANWAQNNKITFTTFKSLATDPKVKELIQEEVEKVNENLARVETIKKMSLLPKELDQDDDEVTATRKVKRKVIAKKFSQEIEAMYGS
ncbi:AMP-dependent synthetase/ligase [Thermodesulfobacteriota bacterium]